MVLTFLDERRKRIKTAHADGIEVGRAENHAAWTAWNHRRIEAEKRSEPFDEPPPSLNGR